MPPSQADTRCALRRGRDRVEIEVQADIRTLNSGLLGDSQRAADIEITIGAARGGPIIVVPLLS